MEYPAFTFSVPDINIGLVSVFTVDIDLVDITQSHSVHRLSVSYAYIIVPFATFVNLFLSPLPTFFID